MVKGEVGKGEMGSHPYLFTTYNLPYVSVSAHSLGSHPNPHFKRQNERVPSRHSFCKRESTIIDSPHETEHKETIRSWLSMFSWHKSLSVHSSNFIVQK
jgi:hypothetical protein